jgi:tripartite-type tricarboxylate transporter receptor subunit TctC
VALANIAAEAVVHAPPDGYTLLLASAANTINATLYEKLNFNFIRDIVPVAGIIRFSNVIEVTPTFSAKTFPEFIAYAKANPGKINMASPSIGTAQYLTGELLKMATGIDVAYVPYRGSAPGAIKPELFTGLTHDTRVEDLMRSAQGNLRFSAVAMHRHYDMALVPLLMTVIEPATLLDQPFPKCRAFHCCAPCRRRDLAADAATR